jgi:hypothetical protein
MQAWHRIAMSNIRTKEWNQNWNDFAYAWTNVKYAAGEGALQAAIAKACKMEPPRCAAPYTGTWQKLITVCRELQRDVGDKPFFLSARSAADILELDHPMQASRVLKQFCGIGILELVKKHSHPSRLANKYRYLPELDA